MATPLQVIQLFDQHGENLRLSWLAGHEGGERAILLAENERQPTACGAVGYLNLIHPYQIQLIGWQEIEYLDSLSLTLYQDAITQIFVRNKVACIIVADGAPIKADFQQHADQHHIPLFSSNLGASEIMGKLHDFFFTLLAERVTLHGVFMEVLGTGILIMGASGLGKSELALELISRGHRLVADDAPEFTKISPNIINGTCPLGMTPFLEVRGLGILNIQTLYGDSAIKPAKYLRLIVQLVQVSQIELQQIDRLEGSFSTYQVLGVEIPQISLPVAPGRNLAVLVECAVRNHNLKAQGYNALEDFMKRQQQAIEKGHF